MRSMILRVVASLSVIVGLSIFASAQAAKVDLTGKWLFNVETQAGAGTPTVTLKQDGEKLTGHYTGQLGDTDLTGTVKGSDFTFGFSGDVQGNKLEVAYKGTIVNKDELKGTLSITAVGDGTFTAKRQ